MDFYGALLLLPGIISPPARTPVGWVEVPLGKVRIIVLFVLFGVLITGFVGVQIWKQEAATVPPRVFKKRSVWSSEWFGAGLGAAFFVMVFYVSAAPTTPL